MSSPSSPAPSPTRRHPKRHPLRRLTAALAIGTLAAGVATAGLGAQVATAPPAAAATCSSDFTDVPRTSAKYGPVTWLSCQGITQGYADGSFGVGKAITRGEIAAFLYRQVTPNHPKNGATYFTDVPGTGKYYSNPVTWMAQAGLAKGYADRSFGVHQAITRGEMANFIYRLAGATKKGPPYSPFKDMGWSTPSYHEASWLEAQGIASGYQDGTFRPRQTITRGETAIMLQNAHRYISGRGDVTTSVINPLPSGGGDSGGSTAAWKTKAASWATAKAKSSSSYYQWGGNGPNGYDCSGFIVGAFAAGGKGGLPRRAADQYRAADSYVPLSQVQVGDLVYWSSGGSVYHIAIYVGNGKIAHARNEREGVSITSIDYAPYNMLSVAGRYN
ncbi:S-layer homology domain-containing protein [Citricoccus nitrophenolicus]|uniref:S-layer homology domain-containing protein n=1 Tax=Citricoccus nitrophenolicus TaxID=863575 RepID=UPI0031E7876B